MSPNYDNRMHEKLEVLDGSRPGSKENAAVRLKDLAQILSLAEVKTQQVSSAPTAADFNSLLGDLRALSNAVRSLAEDIRKRQSR